MTTNTDGDGTDDSVDASDRHEIDCRCGHTAVGESKPHAEENHLRHFLNDHEGLEKWERETAQEQLEYAKERRSVDTDSEQAENHG